MPKHLSLCVLVTLALLLAACQSATPTPANTPADFYGSWIRTSPADGMSLTISRDGHMSTSSGQTYTFTQIDAQTLQISVEGLTEPLRVSWKLEGETLSLTSNNITEIYSYAPLE